MTGPVKILVGALGLTVVCIGLTVAIDPSWSPQWLVEVGTLLSTVLLIAAVTLTVRGKKDR